MKKKMNTKPKVFIIDVDGVMTTGHMLYTENGKTMKVFGPDDHDGLSLLKKNLENLKIEEKSVVFNEKTNSFFNKQNNESKFEIIFFDPPFAESFFLNELRNFRSFYFLYTFNLTKCITCIWWSVCGYCIGRRAKCT